VASGCQPQLESSLSLYLAKTSSSFAATCPVAIPQWDIEFIDNNYPDPLHFTDAQGWLHLIPR
jgi:hypothetical protein